PARGGPEPSGRSEMDQLGPKTGRVQPRRPPFVEFRDSPYARGRPPRRNEIWRRGTRRHRLVPRQPVAAVRASRSRGREKAASPLAPGLSSHSHPDRELGNRRTSSHEPAMRGLALRRCFSVSKYHRPRGYFTPACIPTSFAPTPGGQEATKRYGTANFRLPA